MSSSSVPFSSAGNLSSNQILQLPSSESSRKFLAARTILDDYALHRIDVKVVLERVNIGLTGRQAQDFWRSTHRARGRHIAQNRRAFNLAFRSCWIRFSRHPVTSYEHVPTSMMIRNTSRLLTSMDTIDAPMTIHIRRIAKEHAQEIEGRLRNLGHAVPLGSTPKLIALQTEITCTRPREAQEKLRRMFPSATDSDLDHMDAEMRAQMYRMYLNCFLLWKSQEISRFVDHTTGSQNAPGPPAA